MNFQEIVLKKDLELIKYAIKYDSSLFDTVYKLSDNFSHVCRAGLLEMAQMIVEKYGKKQPLFRLDSGLILACSHGHLELVKYLFSLNDLGEARGETQSPNYNLGTACLKGHMHVVRYLIEKGADAWIYGLENACSGGHLDIVKLMIEKGANKFDMGFLSACCHGHTEIIELLNTLGRFSPECYHKGLWYACHGGHLKIVKIFFKDHLTSSSSSERVCAHTALEKGHLGVVKLIVEKSDAFIIPTKREREILDIGLNLTFLEFSRGYPELLKFREGRVRMVKGCLSYFLIDDLLGVVMVYSEWVKEPIQRLRAFDNYYFDGV